MRSDAVCDRAGVTYRQLDHWTTIGLVHAGTGGHARERDYAHSEVDVVVDMAVLVKAGVAPRRAVEMARFLHTSHMLDIGGRFMLMRKVAA